MDDHKNFSVSAVATAPSPAASGTSLVVTAAHGGRFPSVPFNATIWPTASQPTVDNAEIVRVTAVSTDTLTIVRAQEGTSARTVVVGDQIAATILDSWMDEAESRSQQRITLASHGFAVGDVLYYTGSAYAKAQADTAVKAEVVGIVTLVPDANTFVMGTAGSITGLSGLTAGTVYFLSPSSAGALTSTEPTTAGQVSKPLLVATSTTAGVFVNFRGLVLGESMTVPTVISVGAEFSGTGVPTATLPGTHAINDILLLILQSSNDASVTAPAGYQQLGPQNAIGAASTAGTVKLSIFWKRDNGAEGAPTIPDTGDHTYGVMVAVRGCPTVGDPFHYLGCAWKFATSTAGTSPKGATSVDNCLILDIFGTAIDNAAAQGSSPTNADLSSVAEQFDDGTSDGTGGGIYVMSGTKAEAGPISASTVTWGTTTVEVCSRVAFLPEGAVALLAQVSRPAEIQTFIGSPPDLDDLWVKPAGARRVKVQMIDGGGSGSSGHTVTTAAGGGGGGGGGYSEREFRADDLAATVTVHAGKGGAATTAAVDQAGNPGVVSQFGKGLTPPHLAANIAGTAATAAASADGGNGGCGSGAGRVSPAVATTRISAEAATAGAASGFVAGRGGSGTTAPVGGSPAIYGGGGGESGADSDAGITSANNGWSQYGGGGGAAGRTTGTASGAGHGGGADAPAATHTTTAGADSAVLPYGGSGGSGGDSTTPVGGSGGFPGGGGGGGGGNNAGTQGGRGGHGCVVVTTLFS